MARLACDTSFKGGTCTTQREARTRMAGDGYEARRGLVETRNVTIHLPAPGSSFFSLHDDLADRGGACSDPKANKDQ